MGGADPRQPPAVSEPRFQLSPLLASPLGVLELVVPGPRGQSLLAGDWRGGGSRVNCARSKVEGRGQGGTCPPRAVPAGKASLRSAQKAKFCLVWGESPVGTPWGLLRVPPKGAVL